MPGEDRVRDRDRIILIALLIVIVLYRAFVIAIGEGLQGLDRDANRHLAGIVLTPRPEVAPLVWTVWRLG